MQLFEKLSGTSPLVWDRALITDSLSDEAVDMLCTAKVSQPEKVLMTIDHDTPVGTVAVAAKQHRMMDFAKSQGIAFQYGQGIGYYLAMESGLGPGELVLCTGRHAATLGAAGAVALTLDAPAMKAALETGLVTVGAPVCRVQLVGSLGRYASVSDLALQMISGDRYAGKLVALHGPQLSMAQRITLCNLLAHAEVKSAFFVEECPEADVIYDLAAVKPLAVLPGGFDQIVPASRVDGLRVNQVFIGGCAGGSLEALRTAAAIWRGKQVCKYVRVMVAPATASIYAQAIDEGLMDVFLSAGVLVMNQGCSACWAQSQGRCDEREVFVTTGSINCANWAGRQHNSIYITSVERAAQAALSGSLYEN